MIARIAKVSHRSRPTDLVRIDRIAQVSDRKRKVFDRTHLKI